MSQMCVYTFLFGSLNAPLHGSGQRRGRGGYNDDDDDTMIKDNNTPEMEVKDRGQR
jgi:hypothetical protein